MTLKLRAKVNFPASVTGAAGIAVTKTNGIWTISPDFGTLTELTAIPSPENRQLWIYTPSTGVYNVVTFATLSDALNAIPIGVDLDLDGHKITNLADGTDDTDAINKGQADAAYQPVDDTLTSISGLGTAADKIAYTTGVDTWAEADLTASARSLLDDTSVGAMRTTLGLAIGTDVQAQDAELQAIAGLTSSANKLPYFTGAGTATLTDFSSFGRSLIDDADASTARTTLGVAIGTNVQAYNARLADIAGVTYAQGDLLYFNGTNLVNLGPGTDGQFLKTQGTGANPVWTTIPGGGDMLSTNNLSDVADAATSRANLGVEIGVNVQAYDIDTLKSDTTAALTKGYTSASVSAGTKSSGTYTFDPTAGSIQHATNGGAHTFAPPASHGAWILDYTNNGSAGAITTSGWTKVDGDPFDTTNAHAFRCMISVGNSGSYLSVKRMA